MSEQKQKPRTFLNTMTTLLVAGVAVCSAPNTQALTICGQEITDPYDFADTFRLPDCRKPIIVNGKVKVCVKHYTKKETHKPQSTTIKSTLNLQEIEMNRKLAGVIFDYPAWKYDENQPIMINEESTIRRFVKQLAQLLGRKNVHDFIVQTEPDKKREKHFDITEKDLIQPGQCSDMLYVYDYKKKYMNSEE